MHFPISGRNQPSTSKVKLAAAHNHDDDDPTSASTAEREKLSFKERFDQARRRKAAEKRYEDVYSTLRETITQVEDRHRGSASTAIAPDMHSSPIDRYVRTVVVATPLELIEIERKGVPGEVLKSLARKMSIPISHMYKILDIAKATAEKKTTTGKFVTGSSGHAAIGMIKLLGIAQSIAANSTAAQAADFNVGKWLGQWIDRPQAALGGRKPSDLIDTPTGIDVVARLLGSIESGAYQ